MANRPLGSLKFKNLPDTYVVPQLDSTLAVQGKAADSKATGDAIAAVEAAVPAIDSTLAVSGQAADSKATGDAISAVQASVPVIDATLTTTGKAADAKAVGDAIAAIDSIDPDVLAPEFSSSTAYTKGQFVWHSDDLYRFTTDHAAGSWNSSDVEVAVLGNNLNADVVDLRSAIDDFEDTITSTETIKSSNLLDITNATTGYYWSSGHVDSTSYNNTGYIEVEEGKTITFQYGTKDVSNNRLISSIRFIAAYDKDKNYVSASSQTAQTSYTVPTGIKYVILGIASGYLTLNNSQWSAVVYSTEVVPYEAYFTPYSKTEIKVSALPEIVRRQIRVLATDSESNIIEKLVDAYNAGNTDVIFDRADYSFGTGLESVATTYNLETNEIPIGNNCRYYFNGSHLTATIDLSQHPASGDDEFYCNFFGCQRKPSSFELHDGVLEATDTRYVVHDESSGLKGSYKHLYQNMELIYHTSAREEDIRKCIGGGTGESGVIEIVGCKFTTDGTDSCVSYHGNGTDVEGATFDMNVRDSWFSNNLRIGVLSEHQTARLFYAGNSAMGAPTTYTGCTVTAFLNEVRV